MKKNNDKISLRLHLKNLLGEGNVKIVLSTLSNLYPDDNEVIILKSRYTQFEKSRYLYLISEDNLDKRLNQIVYSLTEYVDNKLKDIDTFISLDADNEIESAIDEVDSDLKISFISWAIRNFNRMVPFIIIVLIVSSFFIAFPSLIDLSEKEDSMENALTSAGIVIHILLSIILVPYIYKKIKINEDIEKLFFAEDDRDSINAGILTYSSGIERDFKMCWALTWIGWGLLYILYAIQHFSETSSTFDLFNYILTQEASDTNLKFTKFGLLLVNVTRNITTIGFIGCFSILFLKRSSSKLNHYYNPATIISVAILSSVLLIQLFSCYFGIGYSSVFFDLITLIFSAVSISLLANVLNGKILNNSLVFPIVFYIYASIQISSAIISDPNDSEYLDLKPFFITTFLLGKLVLFIFLQWLVETGRFRLYALRMSKIDSFNRLREDHLKL